jgi:hypothetical protein
MHRTNRIPRRLHHGLAVAVAARVERGWHSCNLVQPCDLPVVRRFDLAIDGWNPGTAVGVDDPRNPGASERSRVDGDEHVRTRPEQLEVIVRVLGKHSGCVWGKPFATLYLAVEAHLALDGTRVGEDAAMPQRSRSELGASLHPPDDATAGDQFRALTRDVVELLNAIFGSALSAR